MPRRSDRNAARKRAEKRYAYRVDLEVPPTGLGRKLNEMDEWCHRHVHDYEHHSWQELEPGKVPTQIARYYFTDLETAEEFQIQFGGTVSERD